VTGRAALAIGTLALAVLWGVADVRCRRDPHYLLDGLEGCVLPLAVKEDTVYAPGYSTEAFRRVRTGMSKDEVFALLGEPLNRYAVDDGREGWRWTRSARDSSYRVRVALFTGERISEMIHYFYLD
jgi:hypothetical protein